MTTERRNPTFYDAFGLSASALRPDLWKAMSRLIKDDVFSKVGIQLSDAELEWLRGRAQVAASDRIIFAPTTGKSHKAVKDLASAAKKLKAAIALVHTMADEPVELGRANLAHLFVGDTDVADDDDCAQQLDISIHPTDELLERLAHDAERLSRRAEYALNTASLAKRGTGRRVEGYPEFIRACWKVWQIHRTDKGWSTKNGRGCGPFVKFVDAIQVLLPLGMKRPSVEAVGDAVLNAMEGTK